MTVSPYLISQLVAAAIQSAIQSSARERVLLWLMQPDAALLTLMAGLLLIYLELNWPGKVLPGVAGVILALAALHALSRLPVRTWAAVLLPAAMLLLALQARLSGARLLVRSLPAALAMPAVGIGTKMLIDSPLPALRVHWGTAVALAMGLGAIPALLLRLAARARQGKFRLGMEALVGAEAVAVESLQPAAYGFQGMVLVQGELWQAEAPIAASPGTRLRIVGYGSAPACPTPGRQNPYQSVPCRPDELPILYAEPTV